MKNNVMKIISLKKRKDFLSIAEQGGKAVAKGLLIQARKRPEGAVTVNFFVGYTATKKLGCAVVRNRIKRRLRALSAEVFPKSARLDYDYVIIGRKAAFDRNFEDLKKDLKYTLHATNTHR
jgi:ribonuclease P protein component